jgi:hypothetical protein
MEIIDAYRNLLGTHWEPMDNLHLFTIKKGGRGPGSENEIPHSL